MVDNTASVSTFKFGRADQREESVEDIDDSFEDDVDFSLFREVCAVEVVFPRQMTSDGEGLGDLYVLV